MARPFYTVGHSNRALDEFIALLNIAEVEAVADVRKMPRSRTNPQFNADTLPGAIAPIAYVHIAALGGLRTHPRDAPPSANNFWENKSSPQLRRLCANGSVPGWFGTVARYRACADLRDHVFGGGVVAMPSPHHCRLSAGGWRDRISHSGAGTHRAREAHPRRRADRGWIAYLSAAERRRRRSAVTRSPRQTHEQQRDIDAIQDERDRDDGLDHPVLRREEADQDQRDEDGMRADVLRAGRARDHEEVFGQA